MTIEIQHLGLYFGQPEIDNARSQGEKKDDLQHAWQWLLAASGDVIKERKPKDKNSEPVKVIKAELSPLGTLIEAAFRYRFSDDDVSGDEALQMLMNFDLQDQSSLFETISHVLTLAHAFEMLHDKLSNPELWLSRFAEYSEQLLAADDVSFLEQLWLVNLKVVSGVVLDDVTRFEQGVQQVKDIIDTQIHPEGFFKPLAAEASNKDEAFYEMVLACAALTLACEAATQAGQDLWQYQNRDVSLNTAITYLVYYYFYPDKWRWGEGDLTEEQTQAIFSELGAWIEISTRRVNPRGVEMLLDDQRPFFNAYMGGLTTLSHFKTERAKRFGLF